VVLAELLSGALVGFESLDSLLDEHATADRTRTVQMRGVLMFMSVRAG
jgi:hypothetical protein